MFPIAQENSRALESSSKRNHSTWAFPHADGRSGIFILNDMQNLSIVPNVL